MAVFAVVASANAPALKAAVQAQYGASHLEFADNTWFVSDAGSTKDVADKLGIAAGAGGITGVVLRFAAYSGRSVGSTWSWLQMFPEATPNG